MSNFQKGTVLERAQATPLLPGTTDRELRAALTKLVGSRDCRRLLDSAGESGVLRWPAAHLSAATGVTARTAERVVAARELDRSRAAISARKIADAADVLAHLPPGYPGWEVEVVFALALSATNQVIAVVMVAQGGGCSAVLEPRDAYTPLVRFRATAFVLVHNHPGGDPTPSEADLRLTNRLVAAGRLLAIHMLDHIVVALTGVVSLRERGLMPTKAEIRALFEDDLDEKPF